MVDLETVVGAIATQAEYRCDRSLNLYKTPAAADLVTQAAIGRQLRVLAVTDAALNVCLCEDDYPGWLPLSDLQHLSIAAAADQAPVLSAAEIQARIPQIIAFTQAAMAVPHEYLWGGAVAPNYDCSGLMQAAFAAAGVRLPRDSYQQEAFTQPIAQADLQPGDLIFFGTPERTTHVALYLGQGRYIHSSGKAQGRNGIGIDSLTDLSHPVSQRYYEQLRGCGRVTRSYQPA
jgi:cell wall-associated NlpC family hydrolase